MEVYEQIFRRIVKASKQLGAISKEHWLKMVLMAVLAGLYYFGGLLLDEVDNPDTDVFNAPVNEYNDNIKY